MIFKLWYYLYIWASLLGSFQDLIEPLQGCESSSIKEEKSSSSDVVLKEESGASDVDGVAPCSAEVETVL